MRRRETEIRKLKDRRMAFSAAGNELDAKRTQRAETSGEERLVRTQELTLDPRTENTSALPSRKVSRISRSRERSGHARNFSEDVAAKIDCEIRRIMDEQNDRALKLLDEHRDGVERVVAALREKEQITGEEFVALFENKPLPEKKQPADESKDEIAADATDAQTTDAKQQ